MIRDLTRNTRWAIGLVICIACLLAAGCAVTNSEDSSGTASSGPLPADQFAENAAQDPTDFATSALRMFTSADYVDATEEANIYALVRDQDGNDFTSLNKYNFSTVLNPKTAPRNVNPDSPDVILTRVSGVGWVVAIVIDSSGSMQGERMVAAKEAAKIFVDRLQDTDLAAVIDFDDAGRIVQPLTVADSTGKDALKAAIDSLVAEGATNLGGAIVEAVRAIGARPGQRAAVLLTDGVDTVDTVTDRPAADPNSLLGYSGSWIENEGSTRWQAVELADAVDMPVFTVGFQLDPLAPEGSDDRNAITDLEIIARATGADDRGLGVTDTPEDDQPFLADTADELRDVFETTIPAVIDALTPVDSYLLAFPYPKPPQPVHLLKAKTSVEVPVRTGILYLNGNGMLSAKFSSSYVISY